MRILYPYGEEFTGQRAREVHTINRVHSLAATGLQVTLLLADSPKFKSPESLLGHFGLQPLKNLSFKFLSRRLGIGPLSFVSTRGFYRSLGSWLQSQPPFDYAYVIHLKAADYLESNHPQLPVIFEAHEIFADSFPSGTPKFVRLSALEEKVYARARAVVATSNYLLTCLEERYPIPTKTNVIPNSVQPLFFSVPVLQAEPRRLIYVGSFQKWKGVEIALESMRHLPEFTLDIFGGDPAQISSLKTSAPSNVRFYGYATHNQILPVLAKASVALIPNLLAPKSSLYTFPMKLLEYAAAGRTVVSSDLPVVRELRLGPWARLVTPADPAALAAAIREMDQLRSPDLQQQARYWSNSFTWDKAAAILNCFFGDLSNPSSVATPLN